MLPNHAPLMVAEQFKLLEALFPPAALTSAWAARLAPEPTTSYALRRRQGINEENKFLERFNELMLLETRGFPVGPPIPQCPRHAGRRAAAADLFAGLLQLQRAACRPDRGGLCVRASFRPTSTPPRPCGSIATTSRPRRRMTSPMRSLATHVVCADSDAEAPKHCRPPSISILCAAPRVNKYRSLHRRMLAAYDYTPVDRARIAQNRTRMDGRRAGDGGRLG